MYNFHNHTYRCHHAQGSDEDFVIAAIENGYDTIGFSDHTPYLFPNGHMSDFRMLPKEAQGYVDSINALKEKYKDKINIKLGFEVEYYPDLFEKELKFLKTFNYDYIILGQHFTDNEFEDYAWYSGHRTDSVEILDKYINQVTAAAESGEFTYIAHPDLINFTGDKKLYLEKMEQMVKRLKEIGTPLEFNFLGYTGKRHYPNIEFWKIVSKIGNDVVIGLDAHRPEAYFDKQSLLEVKEILKSLNITPLEKLNLIDANK